MTVSVILMALIQKFKTLPFIKKPWQIWILNLFLSFGLSLPFAVYFYNLSWIAGIWIGLFTFIGAPTLYDALQNQNFINYKPTSLSESNSENVVVPETNRIERDNKG